jgi:hypothetical protein
VSPPEPPSSTRSRKKEWVTFRPTRQSLNNKTESGFNLFRERFKSGKRQHLCVNNETKILFVLKRVAILGNGNGCVKKTKQTFI